MNKQRQTWERLIRSDSLGIFDVHGVIADVMHTNANIAAFDIPRAKTESDDPDIHIGTFRIGDFFVYATFDWKGRHARLTLGDMYVQKSNHYQDGYSNIIIHPDGRVATNWR